MLVLVSGDAKNQRPTVSIMFFGKQQLLRNACSVLIEIGFSNINSGFCNISSQNNPKILFSYFYAAPLSLFAGNQPLTFSFPS